MKFRNFLRTIFKKVIKNRYFFFKTFSVCLWRVKRIEFKDETIVLNNNEIYFSLLTRFIHLTHQPFASFIDDDCLITVSDMTHRKINTSLYTFGLQKEKISETRLKDLKCLKILIDPANHTSHKIANSFRYLANAEIVNKVEEEGRADYLFFATPPIYRKIPEIPDSSNWFYGDKAFFGRGNYFRFSVNKPQLNTVYNTRPDRFDKLGLSVKNRQRRGDKILLCPQSDLFHQLKGGSQSEWISDTVSQIKELTDREIVIRWKNQKNTEEAFQESLKDIYCVVVMSSLAGMQAVMHGVPCVATDPHSTSAMFGETDLKEINDLELPENRYELFCNLANNQWTLNEISSGKMLSDIQDYISR